MSALRFTVLLPLVLAWLAGCSPSAPAEEPATGSMQLSVSVPMATAEDITRVTLTVSGADMAPRSHALVRTANAWGGLLSRIPAGAQRTFHAQAFSADDTLRYEGLAGNVSVTADTTGRVELVLQAVLVPAPFTNEAPLVDSLVAQSSTVAPGGTVSLVALAHDPNADDAVSYVWTASSGSFSAPTQASTLWTAPSTQGLVRVSLTVRDPHGAAVVLSLPIQVTAGRGASDVNVGFNSAPVLEIPTSSLSWVGLGEQTSLGVSARDPEGDPLGYQWSATCAGHFTGATSASATFSPSALPPAPCHNCQLSVVVSDDRGGQSTGLISLCVAPGAIRHAPPEIVSSYQSSLTANAYQVLSFETVAVDPEGSALGHSWAASTGTLGTAVPGTSSSRVSWTAPRCATVNTPPVITDTVTNAFGVTATKRFTVMGVPACPYPESWTLAGSMATSRVLHTATRLLNGKVLVVGGYHSKTYTYLKTAELYDPDTGLWSSTGALATGRSAHTAALLPDGKVLVAGGSTLSGTLLAAAELYDPATGAWSSTRSMSTARAQHTATPLTNGKVLIAGGLAVNSVILATAELYDPATGTWSSTGTMSTARIQHPATRLANGKVLVVGGRGDQSLQLATAELYDPATGTWSFTGSLGAPRTEHALALLQTGQVLIAGGQGYGADLRVAEVYDPGSGTWSVAGFMHNEYRRPTMAPLPDGTALISGGSFSTAAFSELYVPATNTWRSTANMVMGRQNHRMVLLSSGAVLAVGGSSTDTDTLLTAEVYTPPERP